MIDALIKCVSVTYKCYEMYDFTLNSLSNHFSPFENEHYHRLVISLQANNLSSLFPYATDLCYEMYAHREKIVQLLVF
jgi:hypothetical protein